MTATTTSRIVWPRPAVAGCVFCTIVRDTRGVALDQTQRFNFFPASPLCSVIWVFAGDWHLIEQPDQMERPWTGARLPGLAFFGPQLGPLISWNPGETYAITIAFYPDAFSAMTGLDLSPFAGRMVPAEEVLPQPILEPCRSFFDAVRREGVERGCSVLEDKIEIMWAATRPAGTRPMRWIQDWSRSLVLRAALTDLGRSTRQIARRVKSWTGVSQRDLQSLGHTEQLYAKLHEAIQKGDVDWAGLATASGFADQAHMIRQMRLHAGAIAPECRKRRSLLGLPAPRPVFHDAKRSVGLFGAVLPTRVNRLTLTARRLLQIFTQQRTSARCMSESVSCNERKSGGMNIRSVAEITSAGSADHAAQSNILA